MGNSVFPEGLKLQNIPGTVMSYYTEDNKKTLFPSPNQTSGMVHSIGSTEDIGMAIVNSFNDTKSFARESAQVVANTDTVCSIRVVTFVLISF
jgi:hypothetical protein